MNNSEKDFSLLSMDERIEFLKDNTSLSEEDIKLIYNGGGLTIDVADKMVENVIGMYGLPYSIAPGFIINGKKYVVPMVSEEPYVVKSTTSGALIASKNGGFIASDTGSIMIGQIQLTNVPNPYTAKVKIIEQKDKVIELANNVDPILVSFGGGCINVEPRIVDSAVGTLLIVHLLIDVRDAMGAQAINAMVEAVSDFLEKLTGGKSNIKVLSNLAVHRLVRSRVCIKKEDIGGEANVDKFVSAYCFANADPFRAATNNKGIMNGMTPVVIATGNDTRAVESGVHSYASISGQYRPVAIWEKNSKGNLEGIIEVPMAVGVVGGTTKFHPGAQTSLKLMDIKSANELGHVIASVGLAANLGVLYSLVTVGLHDDFEGARK